MKSVVIETTKDDTISIAPEAYGYDAEGVRVWKETEDVRSTYITDRFDTYTQVLIEQKSSGEMIEVHYWRNGKTGEIWSH